MTEIIFMGALFISSVSVTGYRSVPEQTDNTPLITASNEYVHSAGVAVSRDLHIRYGGILRFGDFVWVEGLGLKVVTDLMHKRHRKSVDVWVKTKEEEAKIWRIYRNRQVKFYRVVDP